MGPAETQPIRRFFSPAEIEEMGVTLLKAFTDAGNTIVTSKEGAEKLRELDKDEMIKAAIQEMALKAELIRDTKRKPKHKYASNLQPSPKRHRKSKKNRPKPKRK